MKSAELRITDVRIGSLIHGIWEEEDEEIDEYIEKWGIVRVVGLDENSSLGDGWSWMVESRHEEEVEMYSGFSGIPLTEEWLIKFGAKKFDSDFIIDRFRLLHKSAYGYYYVIDKQTNVYFSKVEFVHEWQNLFFAMNGMELILNETT